ncbi:MAG: helicase, partial [Candidatus Saccharibacteria bacterium]|nr:helicase [Pseudorhodobacter sp.]
RSVSETEHLTLLARLFDFLTGRGLAQTRIPSDWLAKAVARIDIPGGDIDTLSKRLAYIRTWTYVAQRNGWVDDENHWREETRAVEDRLSDALHAALTQRFVDRRTSILMRRLKQKETLVAEVNDKGEVTVEGEFVGRIEGFRFQQDGTGAEGATLRQAAMAALKPHFHLLADKFYNAPDTEMDFTTQGGLMWGNSAIGKLVKGGEAARPQVEVFVEDEVGTDIADKVRRRAQHFIDRKIAAQFEPLMAMARDETLQGLARGFAFRLVEAMGVLARDAVTNEVKELDQESRSALRKHGVRFGQFTIFLPLLLKPAATRLRLVLWSLWNGLQDFPESPPPGLVTIPNLPEVPRSHYTLAGYHPAGARAIRIDMLERLADLLRAKDSRAGFEAAPEMLSITGMTLEQFVGLMAGLGYKGEKGERVKVKAAPVPVKVEEPVEIVSLNPVPEEVSLINPVPEEVALPTPEAEPVEEAPPEMEGFYTFTWAPKPRERPARPERSPQPDRGPRTPRPPRAAPTPAATEGEPVAEAAVEAVPTDTPRPPRPEGNRRGQDGRRDNASNGKPREGRPYEGSKPKYEGKSDRNDRGPRKDDAKKTYEARPPRVEKPIDPDNPFAVLAALKLKT